MRLRASRRAVLLFALAACVAAAAGEGVRARTVKGVRFVFPRGTAPTLPLVIGIHGRGADPEDFAQLFRDFPGKVELAIPQAPTPFGGGWSWFALAGGMSDEALAASIGPAEEKLWPAIAELARGRKVIVTGFSQGGMLSFVLAARHPDQIAAAFPIAGGCPAPLLPAKRAAPVFAMHGTADKLIGVEHG